MANQNPTGLNFIPLEKGHLLHVLAKLGIQGIPQGLTYYDHNFQPWIYIDTSFTKVLVNPVQT